MTRLFSTVTWGLALLLTIAGLTACSSKHVIDRAVWGKELTAQGLTVSDWDKYEKSALSMCAQDDPSMFLAVFTDGGASLKSIETNYMNACPERLDRFQAGVRSLAEAKGSADLACGTPADKRTQDQADFAEAMGCK